MSLLRLIARLDIKGPNVVKGICMEGLRIVGKPAELAKKYAQEADELLYIDTVASLYGRNQLESLLEETTHDTFIPITVGGGIKSRADAKRLFDAGADKVALNTAAVGRPGIIEDLASYYGSQAVVVSIEAKRVANGWEAYTNNGREKTGKDAIAWAFESVKLGAGELLITSVDRDGTCRGFDVELIKAIAPNVTVPVIASGGMGCMQHLFDVLEVGKADAVAMATVIHAEHCVTFKEMRDELAQRKLQTESRSESRRTAAG
jgi:cyclase